MRITLNLDDDLVAAARRLARQRGATMGQIVSELVRPGLRPKAAPKLRNGVPLFTRKRGAKKPNLALVNQLRDEL